MNERQRIYSEMFLMIGALAGVVALALIVLMEVTK